MDIRNMFADRRDWLLWLGVACIGAGFIAIGLGWFGAARKDTIPEQFPYVISGGIAGLGLLLTGAALVVTQSFRRDHDRVYAELAELRTALAERRPHLQAVPDRDGHMVVAGRSSYHERDCHLVSERDSSDLLGLEQALDRGLEPCRVCDPPKAA